MARRRHLIGLDKPTTSPLRDVGDEIARLRDQATTHEHHRLESVSELLFLTCLLAHHQILPATTKVEAGPAIFQFGKGRRQHATVAAHCLPAHPLFDGASLFQTDRWSQQYLAASGLKPLSLAAKLRHLHARCDAVDGHLNLADNLIESMPGKRGLRTLLAGCIAQVIADVITAAEWSQPTVRTLLMVSLRHYRAQASAFCRERLEQLESSKAQSTGVALKRVALSCYNEVLRNDSLLPEPLTETGFALLWRDMVA